MIKRSINPKDITTPNICTWLKRNFKILKQKLIELQVKIDKPINIVRYFNIPISIVDKQRENQQEYSRLSSFFHQNDWIDTYRTFYLKTEYTLFSKPNQLFTKRDRILGLKTSLKSFKWIQFIQTIFSDHTVIEIEISYRKISLENSLAVS